MTSDDCKLGFEQWAAHTWPAWSQEKDADGTYKVKALNRMLLDWISAQPPCRHGVIGYCGCCEAEGAPKCQHGAPWFCGHCGPVFSNSSVLRGASAF